MKLSSLWTMLAIGIAAIAVGAWLAVGDGGQGLATLGGGQLIPADSYHAADADTIIVKGTTGQGQWTRITNVIESVSEVRIAIRVLSGPGTYTDQGYPIVWTVDLTRPLGDRVVHDGFQEVPRSDAPLAKLLKIYRQSNRQTSARAPTELLATGNFWQLYLLPFKR